PGGGGGGSGRGRGYGGWGGALGPPGGGGGGSGGRRDIACRGGPCARPAGEVGRQPSRAGAHKGRPYRQYHVHSPRRTSMAAVPARGRAKARPYGCMGSTPSRTTQLPPPSPFVTLPLHGRDTLHRAGTTRTLDDDMDRTSTKVFAAIAATLMLAACGGDGGSATPGEMAQGGAAGAAGGVATLTGAGATFPYPIYSRWFSDYAAATGVRVNYQSIGSGGGIRQLTERTVD